MKGQSRLLRLLLLFTEDKYALSAEEIAAQLGTTLSTVYRDLSKLRELGFVEPWTGETFILGGQISILDRISRMGNPLLASASDEMKRLANATGLTVTLTRLYFDSLIGLGHVTGDTQVSIGYERGQIVPLFRGCTGKVLLAAMPWRRLKRIYGSGAGEAKAAGLGDSWEQFLKTVRDYGKLPFVWTEGEVNPDNVAIAAAIHGPDKEPIGSVTLILHRADAGKFDFTHIERELVRSCEQVEARLAGDSIRSSDGATGVS